MYLPRSIVRVVAGQHACLKQVEQGRAKRRKLMHLRQWCCWQRDLMMNFKQSRMQVSGGFHSPTYAVVPSLLCHCHSY